MPEYWFGHVVIGLAFLSLFFALMHGAIEIRNWCRERNPFEQVKEQLQSRAAYAKARRDREVYRMLQEIVYRGYATPNTVYHRVRDDGKIEAGVVLTEVVQIPWYLRCWWKILQKSEEKFNKARQNS